MNQDSEIDVIFEGPLWEASMVTSMLKDADIKTTMCGGMKDPYSGLFPSMGGTKVMILKKDYEQASSIIKQYLNNRDEYEKSK